VTPTAGQRGRRGRAFQGTTRAIARGVLVIALVFSAAYMAYVTFSVAAARMSTGAVARPVALTLLLLATLVCLEMLLLGLNVSFLVDRLVPREYVRSTYWVLAATAVALGLGLVLAGDKSFAAAVAALILPGAAAFGILMMFSPAYVARQEEKALERQRRAGTSGRTASPAQKRASRPASGKDPGRSQTGAASRQRRGGRKRH
jgi:hypothetical protein